MQHVHPHRPQRASLVWGQKRPSQAGMQNPPATWQLLGAVQQQAESFSCIACKSSNELIPMLDAAASGVSVSDWLKGNGLQSCGRVVRPGLVGSLFPSISYSHTVLHLSFIIWHWIKGKVYTSVSLRTSHHSDVMTFLSLLYNFSTKNKN